MIHLVIGAVLVFLGLGLILIGRPNKTGQSPRFLQFESSVVLYPPVILVFMAMGMTEIITAMLGISR